MGRCRRGGGQTGGYPPPSQFAMVVARRRQGGFLQLPCSLGFRLAASATGGARLPQFPMVVARRRQGGFLQLPCSLGFRLAFSATGGARLPQFPMVVGRRRQGGFLQLPCSLGFRLASSATGGARLRPPAAFKKAGENLLENFSGFLADYAARRSSGAAGSRLSKKWLAPLFRGFHSSLAPTARPGSYAGKPLLRKAFCGFDAHVAKSDYSLWGLRPPNPPGFFDRLQPAAHQERRARFVDRKPGREKDGGWIVWTVEYPSVPDGAAGPLRRPPPPGRRRPTGMERLPWGHRTAVLGPWTPSLGR